MNPHVAHDRNMTIDPHEADDVRYEQRLAVAMSRIQREPDTVAEIFFGEEFSNYCHGNAVTAQADRINEILWSMQEERGVNHDK